MSSNKTTSRISHENLWRFKTDIKGAVIGTVSHSFFKSVNVKECENGKLSQKLGFNSTTGTQNNVFDVKNVLKASLETSRDMTTSNFTLILVRITN